MKNLNDNNGNGSGRVPAALSKYRRTIKRITVSAVFLSISLVLKLTVSFYLPFLGAAGIKVDFAGIFTIFPALLFGPVYGGIVYGAADLLAAVIKPQGAYIPWLTLTSFMSGFLSGLAWKFVRRSSKKTAVSSMAATAVILAIVFVFGVAGQVSLNLDDVMVGIIAEADSMPEKAEVSEVSLSPLSEFICGVARYSNDTLMLRHTGVDGKSALLVPEKSDYKGSSCKITELSPSSFEGCSKIKAVYLSSNVKSIAGGTFGEFDEVTIYAPGGSYAESYAKSNGISFTAASQEEFIEMFEGDIAEAEFSFSSSGTYRAYLAAMINLLTLGCEIVALFGGALLTYGFVRYGKKMDGTGKIGYMRVFIASFIPRFIVTTINTYILKMYIGAYAGRAFIVLWIPRAIEEVITCVIQAYFIMLLLKVYESKIAKKFDM